MSLTRERCVRFVYIGSDDRARWTLCAGLQARPDVILPQANALEAPIRDALWAMAASCLRDEGWRLVINGDLGYWIRDDKHTEFRALAAYEEGLRAARDGNAEAAESTFCEAIEARPDLVVPRAATLDSPVRALFDNAARRCVHAGRWRSAHQPMFSLQVLIGKPRPREQSAPRPTARSNLPLRPSADEIVAAVRSVRSAVLACGVGDRERVVVSVTVAARGRVATAHVQGPTGAKGTCIARAVRAARFLPFQEQVLRTDLVFEPEGRTEKR